MQPEIAGILLVCPRDPVACMECGETMPSGSDRCGKCGWSYRD